jgi:tyrosyl-tRNA synthetase
MDTEAKVDLVKRLPTEEVVTDEELASLFNREAKPKHYIGLEISGPLHVGTLITSGFKIRDFIKAGIRSKVFLADWHTFINNKFGGDWDKIKRVGREYYADAFTFFCPGVEIEYGSNLYAGNDQYWKNLVTFSKHVTLARDTRCLTIMGRTAKEKLDVAQYLYPPMQATDIKAMDLDIAHSGIDQRKVHILAREVFPTLKWKKPVAVHHHLLLGLNEPKRLGVDDDPKLDMIISNKMSKSKPETAVFIHDTEQDISRKLGKAWCPEKLVENNPVLDYAKHLVFHEFASLEVERPAKYGGDMAYGSYAQLEEDYRAAKLHPSALKTADARALNKIIEPVRRHFEGKSIISEVYSG